VRYVRIERPPPGEELNEGPETPARQAASLILLREADGGPEVLLVQRNPDTRFMGGAWVFPGGSVHGDDADHADAALRELEEEAGLTLRERSSLVPFSRWITPAQVKVRFDTMFFVAAAPDHAQPKPDGFECVDACWIRPADALAAGTRGELMLVFPTIKHLEQLAQFESVDEALATARARDVVAVQPRIVVNEGAAQVLLPGEPGFDDEAD
jgi:8-oxo-dGTP pyrophosphatase MutT (NUDIX family)